MAKQRLFSGLPPRASKPSTARPNKVGEERLQKILAAAGIDSRRKCEEMIREGRVQVDGRVVTELGTKVRPGEQKIIVDGELLNNDTSRVCYLVNKPTGVVCTNHDPDGRPRVIDLVPGDSHLFTIGRLDQYSDGLILVTNDGELTNRLAHPRYGVEKTYLALVAGEPDPKVLDRLRVGVRLAEGFAHCKEVRVKGKLGNNTIIEIVLDEGRNREIRRVLARVGHKVLRLTRTAIGKIKLGDIPVGGWRKLTDDELAKLHTMGEATGKTKARRKPTRSPRYRSVGSDRPIGRDRPIGGGRPAAGGQPVKAARPARPPRKQRPAEAAPIKMEGGRGRRMQKPPERRPDRKKSS